VEVILSAVFAEDGLPDIDPARSVLIDRALRRETGIARFNLSLHRPLIGLGASAGVYYPAIAAMLASDFAVPADADVANAVGAVVGQVRSSVAVTVSSPEEGLFIITGGGEAERVADEATALERARLRASELARTSAEANGAVDVVLLLREEQDAPEIEGRRKLVEARITATATGRPRTARN
jgi:N-methylhydantoinase A/oxoprolinase/acetone carboxylase beta subunit